MRKLLNSVNEVSLDQARNMEESWGWSDFMNIYAKILNTYGQTELKIECMYIYEYEYCISVSNHKNVKMN